MWQPYGAPHFPPPHPTFPELKWGVGGGSGVCLGKDYFRPTNFRESLFLMHECLNRDHHRCDKPLKAKVFFILYPSRAV